MPTLSPSGVIYLGFVGSPTSRNGIPIGPGAIGQWAPLTDDVGVGQVCDASGCRTCRSDSDLSAPGIGPACDVVTAGAGRWATFHDFQRFDSVMGVVPNLYPLAMSEQGDLATFNYLNGQTVQVTDVNGTVRYTLDVGVQAVYGANLRGGILAFNQTGLGWTIYTANGVLAPGYLRRTDGVYACLVAWINSQVWLVEINGVNTVTFRHYNETTAYILDQNTQGEKNRLDARQLPDGTIRVIWATNEAEPPGSLVQHDLTLAQIMALPSIDITAPPVVVIPPPSGARLPVAPSVAFPAPCWTGRAEAARANDPANAYWSKPLTGTPIYPIMETSPYAPDLVGTDYLCGLWLTDSPTKTLALEELDQEIAYTKQRGRWALNIHCDNLTHEPVALAAAVKVRQSGLVPILSAHAFDNPVGFAAQVNRFAALGAWGISRGCRAKSADTMETADRLRRDLAGCVVDFFLNLKAWPECEPYANQIAALTVKPEHYPGWTSAPPLPPTGGSSPWTPNADSPVTKNKPARKSWPWGR